jgi:hypothetical protein
MANRGASPRNLFTRKKFNDATSYRVGEASRAHPKGLALLPNTSPSEMYQYRFTSHKDFELVRLMITSSSLSFFALLKIPVFDQNGDADVG